MRVIEPGHALIRRILQRGVDRGEFRPMDMKYGVYTVLAPMLFSGDVETLTRRLCGGGLADRAGGLHHGPDQHHFAWVFACRPPRKPVRKDSGKS